jgi:hypothetical protein
MNTPSPPRDPLAARPVVPPTVEMRRDREGRVHLRRPVSLGPGWLGRMLMRWGLVPARRTLLDERGSGFWELIDGERTLREIATLLRDTLHLDSAAAEEAVVLFTKMLMRRGLIALDVRPRAARPTTPDHA